MQILDKLLDRESQTHKPQTLSSFYSSKPAASSQRSPSKHATTSHGGVGAASGGLSKHTPSSAPLPASTTNQSNSVSLAPEDLNNRQELSQMQGTLSGENAAEAKEHGDELTLHIGFIHLLNFRIQIRAVQYYLNV